MAETAQKTTNPRRGATRAATTRKTAATKPAASKATPAKAATKEEAPATEEPTKDRFVVEMEFVEDTKTYAKFAVPESLKGTMVGNLYVPHGTDRVKVAIFGVDAEDGED